MKISTMIAFSAGAVSSVLLVKALEKPCPAEMVTTSNIKDKIMKLFE